MKNNEEILEPNNNGEIYLGSPMSIGQKFNLEQYKLKIENYEAQARECRSIKEIPHYQVCVGFYICIIPKFFEKKV